MCIVCNVLIVLGTNKPIQKSVQNDEIFLLIGLLIYCEYSVKQLFNNMIF